MSLVSKIVTKYARLASPASEAKETSFAKVIAGKKFRSSKSGRMVQFKSLPPEDQKRIRAQHSRHFKRKLAGKGVLSPHMNAKKAFNDWHAKNHGPTATKKPVAKKSRTRNPDGLVPVPGKKSRTRNPDGLVPDNSHPRNAEWSASPNGMTHKFSTDHGTYVAHNSGHVTFRPHGSAHPKEIGRLSEPGIGRDGALEKAKKIAGDHHDSLQA